MQTIINRRAFTLIELLVVISIIALLVAILMPQLGAARSLARMALCQHNLHQISQGFHSSQALQTPPTNSRFPEAGSWPGIPYNSVPSNSIFLCPEDSPGNWNPMGGWTVTSEYGPTGYYQGGVRFTINMDPPSFGCDKRPKAGYTEYAFEDGPGIVTDPAGWGYDGTFWVYDLPGKGKRIVWQYFTCTQDNRSFLTGKPLYEPYGDVRLCQVPLKTYRDVGGVYTSYAINKQVCRTAAAPASLVLLDYYTKDSAIADPSTDIWPLIQAGARHRNRCNVLVADDHVEVRGATLLDPKFYLTQWTP